MRWPKWQAMLLRVLSLLLQEPWDDVQRRCTVVSGLYWDVRVNIALEIHAFAEPEFVLSWTEAPVICVL